MSERVRRKIICIVGCTGTGKSALAISLAKQIEGEIVNADAMQVFFFLFIKKWLIYSVMKV
jgi:tRNA dimethylallyltransferase